MQGVYSQEDFINSRKNNFDLVIHNEHQFNIVKDNNSYENLWFKVNTGMNRLGFEVEDFLKIYDKYLNDKDFTLMSHLSASNIPNDPSNKTQFGRCDSLASKLHSNVSKYC